MVTPAILASAAALNTLRDTGYCSVQLGVGRFNGHFLSGACDLGVDMTLGTPHRYANLRACIICILIPVHDDSIDRGDSLSVLIRFIGKVIFRI